MSDPNRRIIRLVKVDTMGRVRLGPMATAKFYHADVRDDGVIVLKPVIPNE